MKKITFQNQISMNKHILSCILFAVLTIASKAAVYNVMDFGARNNGLELTTLQIQNTIDMCFLNGGLVG